MPRLGGLVADSGPVVVLAGIAAAGSFTHIRDTARQHGQHGWMAWAIAVCIDLTCVMAARERQRDRRTGRRTGPISWPSLVLAGGVVLSLAANLAQAEPTPWGWLTAATPAGAFLVAVSMLERRSTGRRPAEVPSSSPSASSATVADESSPVPPSFGRPSSDLVLVRDDQDDAPRQDERRDEAASAGGPAAELLTFARRVATEHEQRHGRPITRDALRARLGISNQLASDLLRQIRTA
ncbi:DUF2637 domain-containing protein [Actinoallomurus rhizosphaericola]|uniref:DUF2637 domain-containing protein n=1 Tax=Actinoallomurus rhizosphaericola TaxID=2952536 RepID=UPI002090A1EC|nr:DUF2637 domain-containing protein [Actinoallomurus rhizosphaericola]MCO5993001.1 DUF2637 domain-containing protein [Actinoallomurus rhizosphaericola]